MLAGATRWEPRPTPHAHFVCDDCSRLVDLPVDPTILLALAQRSSRFRMTRTVPDFEDIWDMSPRQPNSAADDSRAGVPPAADELIPRRAGLAAGEDRARGPGRPRARSAASR